MRVPLALAYILSVLRHHVVVVDPSVRADMETKPTGGNEMCYSTDLARAAMSFASITRCVLLSLLSRGREGGLGLAQGGYWGGVAESPPGRAIVAAKPVLPETSWTVTGKSYAYPCANGAD